MRVIALLCFVWSCAPKPAAQPAAIPVVAGWECFNAETRNGNDYSFCYRSPRECMEGIEHQRPAGFLSVTGCAPAASAWCVTFVPAGQSMATFFCSRSELECNSDQGDVIGRDSSVLQGCTLAN